MAGRLLIAYSVDRFSPIPAIREIIIVAPQDWHSLLQREVLQGTRMPTRIVCGGVRRQDSVRCGLEEIAAPAQYVLIHDGARPLVSADLITRTCAGAVQSGACIPGIRLTDTLKLVDESRQIRSTLPRDRCYSVQTPQAFRRDWLEMAYRQLDPGVTVTDDAAILEAAGYPVSVIDGERDNLKITYEAEFQWMNRRIGDECKMRIGVGYDAHRLLQGVPLYLGGIEIPSDCGLVSHSDGDALIHAICDALLGAAGLPDIGVLFPDTDSVWRSRRSIYFLGEVSTRIREMGFTIARIDCVVILEKPRLVPYLEAMRRKMAEALSSSPSTIGIKGKTNEGMGFIGSREGVAVLATALLAADDRVPQE